jgi:hypothetical protein
MTLYAPSSDNVILGKGELFFARFASGVKQDYFHLGNCGRLALITEDDVIELNTSMDASGGLYKSVTRSRTVRAEINANEYALANMALALMGDTASVSQTAATSTETFTLGGTGRYLQLTGKSVTSISSVVQGTATLTATTDYTLYNQTPGVVKFPSTGGATAGAVVVTYIRATASLDAVAGATKTKIEGSLLFVPDPTTGPKWGVECWRVSVNPGGEMSFIGTEFGEYQMTMRVLDDTVGSYGGSSTYPYYQLINYGTAS